MLELHQIEQLVTIADAGTLSATAERLHLSQSALSRSMQRLETELGAALFTRSRNRLVLNTVGKRAVERARVLLGAAEDFTQDLRSFAARLSTIAIGANSPAPLWRLSAEIHERFPNAIVLEELQDGALLSKGLREGSFRLILTNEPLNGPGVLCSRYTEERLLLELPPEHPLCAESSLRMEDLAGQTALIYRHVGIWRDRVRAIPGLHLIEQAELDVLEDLVLSSGLPLLASSLFPTLTAGLSGRIALPILGEDASLPLYLCARESDRALFQQLC